VAGNETWVVDSRDTSGDYSTAKQRANRQPSQRRGVARSSRDRALL